MAFQGFLKQSTAVDVLVGPFVDDTDGVSPEAGLTIAQANVLLSKNGQTQAQKNDVTTCAADGSEGDYNCELDATDTDTVGQLTIRISSTGALPIRLDYHIVEEAVYDSMYGGSAAGPLQATTAGRTLDILSTGEVAADLTMMGGVAQSAIDLKDFADAGYDPVTNKVQGVVLVDATTTNAAVQTVVDKIPLSDGTISWNATALGAINAECDTAVAALATTADLLDKLGAVNEAAAAGDPSATESVMQYVKQIVNVLTGSAGIVSILPAAAPASGVSLAEMIRAIYDDTNEVQADDYPTTIAAIQTVVDKVPLSDGTNSWNATALAAINAEVDTALDTVIPELGVAQPATTPTVRTALMLLYMALRNKLDVQTSGTDALEIHNDAGTEITSKLLTDAGGDYSEAKMT